MTVGTYNPKQVILTIGGIPISGYAEGTFINVERDEDSFSKYVGSDGEVSRARTNNNSGTLTLTLAQTSNSNLILSGILQEDELRGDGIVPVIIKDASGQSVAFAAEGWIKKPASNEYSNEVGSREWTIDLAKVSIFTGGN